MSLLRADTGYVQSPDVADEQVAAPVRGNNDFVRVRDARGAGRQREPRLTPYTVSLAFSMAYGGARGGTEAQMAQTPNFLPQEGQHPTFDALDRRASRSKSEEGDSGTPVRLNVANAVWGQRGHRFEGAHPETLARHHGAGLQTPGFRQTEAATGEIDGWVAGETEGRIGDLLPPGRHRTGYAHGLDRRDPLQRLVVVQVRERRNGRRAIHAPRRRGGDGGDDAPGIPLLVRGSADYQAARLPYGGEAADMLIIPPDEGGSGRVEGRLGAGILDEVRGNLPETQVGLTMPRFGFETVLTFIDLLGGLGLRLPFVPYEADLDGVTKGGRLFIYGALHKATITVDERGTGAAAASAILDMPVSGGGGRGE